MKKITCLDCDKEFTSESEEDVLNQMLPHYMQDHKDIMDGNTEESKKEWMERFHKDWEAAEEV